MTNRKLIAGVKKAMEKIAIERDKLRDLISEAEGLESNYSEAYDSLENAVDRLSELV